MRLYVKYNQLEYRSGNMQKTTVMTFPKEFIAFMTETKKEARIVQKNIFSWQVIKGQAFRFVHISRIFSAQYIGNTLRSTHDYG